MYIDVCYSDTIVVKMMFKLEVILAKFRWQYEQRPIFALFTHPSWENMDRERYVQNIIEDWETK